MAPWLALQATDFEFSIRVIKLIGSFLSWRKSKVSVEGEISTPRYMQARVAHKFLSCPPYYTACI
jgi:hypothetical protein